ncbi:IspD/TarI family cytidylyltransferase [Verminephrobacter eiseniae]|uniref:IspD/TarI family cytidylyltransferase n=1 Tax=Verminephrobacter eiseniae TaxID=364317 RepID=UPI00067443DB|nr:2-C-methyl-D-erythritol 4-phosphate cytidylyltransferase [Verminephrobacter eiseniae]MCW5285559.1 2-C-methyl-D-erythritol 4-phosphate cytidylyltransferase [Verminephrobacter eiseniae]MCW5303859.1 2-C-methyl-D-erythritol 4-phosphate cytidylyltransferase [Verminephrobacter eiseniae]MCW8181989.1 2-C-methyl-D-erythritol 4-phosphate cytidylyltransferase [Verminephrobacter eiseniae]MCW8190896.1 2-C-methyl-D-erythritol 4-phosphate cytidylyltransferase [Verminephrobacter eiseniae]
MTDPLPSSSPLAPSLPPSPSRSAPARFWALLPCAGVGTRAAAAGGAASSCPVSAPCPALAPALPKQYQLLAGRPMVLHTLAAFAGVGRLLGTLVAVAPGDHFLAQHAQPAFFVVPCGGPRRADTVLGGLRALLARGAQPDDWVLVHDAARCLVTSGQIEALMEQCANDSVGGLLALRLTDTLKAASDGPGGLRVAGTLERSDKWLAQTPQMFRIGPLLAAIEQAGGDITDEASAMEAQGLRPRLVPGGAQNFKVTYPDDFALAAAVLAQRVPGGQRAESLVR